MNSTSVPENSFLTDEEFNSFHSIDRNLYSKLIIELGRDTVESMDVMAFLMWLEQQTTGGMTLVKRMLSLPSHVINNIANESVVCLKCVKNDDFSYPESGYKLSLLPDMLDKDVHLKFFYDHRVEVLRGVNLICSKVCARAFKDLTQNAHNTVTRRPPDLVGDFNRRASSFGGVDQEGSPMVGQAFPFAGINQGGSSDLEGLANPFAGRINQGGSSDLVGQAFPFPGRINQGGSLDMVGQAFPFPGRINQGGSPAMVGQAFPFAGMNQGGSPDMVGQAFPFAGMNQGGSLDMVDQAFPYAGMNQGGSSDMLGRRMSDHRNAFSFGGVDQAGSSRAGQVFSPGGDDDAGAFSPPMFDSLTTLLGGLNLDEEENEVEPEDRTIFLTFSKGYPISEAEVRDFFTRLFGDFIEELYMQSVPPGEQVLYARMVVRRASMIDAVAGGGKTKYNINGKHVCARKFIKRNQSSSSSSSSAAAAISTPNAK